MERPKQSTNSEINEEYEIIFKSNVLNTGLNPTFGLKTSNHGSGNFEGFLTAVERTLLKKAFRCRHLEHLNKKTR